MKRQIVKLLTILSLLVGSSMAANAQFRYAAVAGFEMTNLSRILYLSRRLRVIRSVYRAR